MATGLDFIMWANQEPAEQPQRGNDKQGFSKLYDMPEVEANS